MNKTLSVLLGGSWMIALMVAALWAWRDAPQLLPMLGPSKPDLAWWALRCGAIAAVAMAQAVLLTFVVGAFYRRDLVTDLLRLSAVLVFILSLAGAISFGLAGR